MTLRSLPPPPRHRFAAQSTPNSSLLTPPQALPFPKLYKLYTLYTKPAPSLQNLYRDCTVLWSKPAQNRGTISLLPVKHWQNIQTIPHKFGKKGEYTHETYFCNCCRYRCCAGSEPGCLRLCRFRRCFLCSCRAPPPTPRLPLPVTSTPTRTSRSSPVRTAPAPAAPSSS